MHFLYLIIYYAIAASVADAALSSEEKLPLLTNFFAVQAPGVHGVIAYTNHALPVKEVIPNNTRDFITDTKGLHLIVEYDVFSASTLKTPYHQPDDFIKEGYFDPEFCLTDHLEFSEHHAEAFASFFSGKYEGKPLWSMLHMGRLVAEYFGHFNTGFYCSVHETIEEAGTDIWLSEKWKTRDDTVHFLEDELDRDVANRLDPDENFLEWRDTKIKDADLKFWKKIFSLIVDERLKSDYLKYQDAICRCYKGGEKVTSISMPVLEQDGGSFKFVYKEIALDLTSLVSTGYCTDLSMVYRNSLWVERLGKDILPKVNGEPFILAVGRHHQFVQSPDGSKKFGIHDYFQDKFGKDCLKPIAAADIPEFLSDGAKDVSP